MNSEHFKILMEVLSLRSCYLYDDEVVSYIMKYCDELGFQVDTDEENNLYIVKGELNEGEYYPMVCSHMDTVHKVEPKRLTINEDIITAFNPETKEQIGLGADDLSGVALCLIMLSQFEKIKCVFFQNEERLCIGSRWSTENRKDWYQDVGYCIEFDSPDGEVTSICDGISLFEKESDFHIICDMMITKHFDKEIRYAIHPWTDIHFIKKHFDFSCINMTCGYRNYHTKAEYLDLKQWENSLNCSISIIKTLDCLKYKYDGFDWKEINYVDMNKWNDDLTGREWFLKGF